MDFNIVSIILVLIVAFLAGMEGILDQFQFHQPIIACSLIGLATGHMPECIILGGALQLIALGWANVGAAVAPDAALASVASAIIFVKAGNFTADGRNVAIAAAITLATVGLVLTMVVRTLSVVIVHQADRAAEQGSFRGVEFWHMVALACQGLRIAIPAILLLFIPSEVIQHTLGLLPEWFTKGMTIGGGFVVAVGYAMVINLRSMAILLLRICIGSIKRININCNRNYRSLCSNYLLKCYKEWWRKQQWWRNFIRFRRSTWRYIE